MPVPSRRRPPRPAVSRFHEEPDAPTLSRAGQRVVRYRLTHTMVRRGRHYPINQVELARRAGVSVGCLQGFESGLRKTGPDRVKKIARACETTVEALLAPDGDDPIVPVATPASAELTEEALALAHAFTIASTGVRVAMLNVARDHLAQRRDTIAAEILARLNAASGVVLVLQGKEVPSAPSVATELPFRESSPKRDAAM